MAVLALGYATYGLLTGGIFLPFGRPVQLLRVTGAEAVAAILGLTFLGFSFLGFALMVHDPVDGRRKYSRFHSVCSWTGALLLVFGPVVCALLFG
jgi:hypothetical protein